MAESEQNYLLELWDKNICPTCGKKIPAGKRSEAAKRVTAGSAVSTAMANITKPN